MNFYIADMHFNHSNIIKLCQRPFYSVDDMNRVMLLNWNKKVTNNDDVYIVGDVAFKDSKSAIEIVKQLKGRKHLIVGNHDGKLLRDKDFRDCFVSIKDKEEIVDNGKSIVLFHYPILEWNGYFRGTYHIYGHIHNNVKNKTWYFLANEYKALNAGVEVNDYKPVTFEELVKNNEVFRKNNVPRI